mgnify:CR=1 FL=1
MLGFNGNDLPDPPTHYEYCLLMHEIQKKADTIDILLERGHEMPYPEIVGKIMHYRIIYGIKC